MLNRHKTKKEIYILFMTIIAILAIALPLSLNGDVIIVVDPVTGTAKPVVVVK